MNQINQQIDSLSADLKQWRRRHFVLALIFLLLVAVVTSQGGAIWGICFLFVLGLGVRANTHSCCWPGSRYVYILAMMITMRVPHTTTIGWIGWMVLVVGAGLTILANPNSSHDTQTVTPKPDQQ